MIRPTSLNFKIADTQKESCIVVLLYAINQNVVKNNPKSHVKFSQTYNLHKLKFEFNANNFTNAINELHEFKSTKYICGIVNLYLFDKCFLSQF